jgi:hypothetical protein
MPLYVSEESEVTPFLKEVEESLSEQELWDPQTIDFYRVLGKKDRILIHPLDKS